MKRDPKHIWQECLHYIKARINSEQSFQTWFAPIHPIQYVNKTLVVQVPSQFFYEWLEDKYVELLSEAITHAVGKDARLEYRIVSGPDTSSTKKISKFPKDPISSATPTRTAEPTVSKEDMTINPHYRFGNLIEGDFNRLVRSIGQAIAQNPGITSFNPFMIYGPVGDGKTHTLHAIGNKIKESSPQTRIAYTSAESFTTFFVESLRSGNLASFRQYFEEVNVLLIDDVQHLERKEKTQEMLFHIFNHLHQSNKQIVMTSDCPPRELKGIQARLLSRFKWGITADLQPPDLETRIAIINSKLEERKCTLSPKLIEYIASSVKTNIRELEGVVNSLQAHLLLAQKDATVELIKKIIEDIVQNIETEISIEYIQKMVSDHYRISLADLKGKRKKREIVTPRQVSMFLIKKYMPDYTLSFIGQHFDKRDHTTVGHAIQVVRDMVSTDMHFRTIVNELDHNIRKRLQMEA